MAIQIQTPTHSVKKTARGLKEAVEFKSALEKLNDTKRRELFFSK